MKRQGDQLTFSPSDLVRYVESPFTSWMARMELEIPDHDIPKNAPDPLLSYLADKGYEHEERFFNELRKKYSSVIQIDDKLPEDGQVQATMDAMQAVEASEVVEAGEAVAAVRAPSVAT